MGRRVIRIRNVKYGGKCFLVVLPENKNLSIFFDKDEDGLKSFCKFFDAEKLLNNPEYMQSVIDSGYGEYYQPYFPNAIRTRLSADFLRDYIKQENDEIESLRNRLEAYQKINDEKKERETLADEDRLKSSIEYHERTRNRIPLRRNIGSGDISEYYETYSEIEIKGLRVRCHFMFDSSSECIYFLPYELGSDYAEYEKILGKPDARHPIEGREVSYEIPIYWINKFIHIKKNFTLDSFDDEKPVYSGEEEETILDMNDFDEETYKFFETYGVVRVEIEESKKNWLQRIFNF